jgi:hypothetical protein
MTGSTGAMAGGVGVRTSCVVCRLPGRLVGLDVGRVDAAARPVARALLLPPPLLLRAPFVRVVGRAALRAGLVAGLVDLR